MKKTFFLRLCSLLTVLMLAAAATALAEAPGCPVNAPPALGQYTTGWQLYSGAPVDYRIDLAVDEETALRTYTIYDAESWGIAENALGTWAYVSAPAAAEETEAAGDQQPEAAASGWEQTAQGGSDVILQLSDADYAELGFPAWKAPCAAGADALVVNIYLGQVRQVYAYVDYLFGDNSISITAEDSSFIITLGEMTEAGYLSSYASYDPSGILAYASYAQEAPDGSMTAWRLEAVPAQESYRLTSIMHADAAGNTCYWEHGEWQNADFVKVEAPEGISPEDVPYTLTGEWLGIPFAKPGDAPEGSFPAGAHAADAAGKAADFKPWPDETDALYRSWTEAKTVPALPEARWETLESGEVRFTLTGIERWGVQEQHQCGWLWSDADLGWRQEGEPTPGQLRFTVPAEMTDLYWRETAADPETEIAFTLNRENMLAEAELSSASGDWFWLMDNQGGMSFGRALDSSRMLHAEYEDYRLLQYDILTSDESGALLSQTVFDAPEDAPDTYSLHLYYHYSENAAEEALWLRDIGWYSYETGKPCECPEGVEPEKAVPLKVL